MKILTLIQARTGSTRLPGKVLLPLAGKPLLARMVERVLAAQHAGTVVVATTTLPKDDTVVEICRAEGFNVFRGHPDNLLDRHYKAALEFGADAVVKIPSDCPLIDTKVIDKVLGFFIEHQQDTSTGHGAPSTKFDFVSNLHPATYPDGNDVEVMTFETLETAWKHATLEMELQHTTPYIWERPEQDAPNLSGLENLTGLKTEPRFRIGNITWETRLDYSMSHRWTIDYPEDYQFIKAVYDELYPANHHFGLNDILSLLEKRPDIFRINSKYAGVNWYRNHLGELKTVGAGQTRLEGK